MQRDVHQFEVEDKIRFRQSTTVHRSLGGSAWFQRGIFWVLTDGGTCQHGSHENVVTWAVDK